MAYKMVGEGGGNGADREREELQELARAIADAAKQGAWTAAQAVEQPRQENSPPRLPWPVFRSRKQDSFTPVSYTHLDLCKTSISHTGEEERG